LDGGGIEVLLFSLGDQPNWDWLWEEEVVEVERTDCDVVTAKIASDQDSLLLHLVLSVVLPLHPYLPQLLD